MIFERESGAKRIVLPSTLKEILCPHIGSRIAILRTEISGKEYLFRVHPDGEKTILMSENSRMLESCEASA